MALSRAAIATLGATLYAACGGAGTGSKAAIPPGPGSPSEVAAIRLFDPTGGELTFHIPLITGDTLRIEVRTYAADGHQIIPVTGGAKAAFTFMPANLASSRTVSGDSLAQDVLATSPPATEGTLNVILLFLADSSTKTFSGFPVLVH
ncbi:MAG TPA: hypothetical protein VFD76_10140 [Gemmatimonadales bacterium]|nr:hypothetical protein [Gemmatimonadales bacterium]